MRGAVSQQRLHCVVIVSPVAVVTTVTFSTDLLFVFTLTQRHKATGSGSRSGWRSKQRPGQDRQEAEDGNAGELSVSGFCCWLLFAHIQRYIIHMYSFAHRDKHMYSFAHIQKYTHVLCLCLFALVYLHASWCVCLLIFMLFLIIIIIDCFCTELDQTCCTSHYISSCWVILVLPYSIRHMDYRIFNVCM